MPGPPRDPGLRSCALADGMPLSCERHCHWPSDVLIATIIMSQVIVEELIATIAILSRDCLQQVMKAAVGLYGNVNVVMGAAGSARSCHSGSQAATPGAARWRAVTVQRVVGCRSGTHTSTAHLHPVIITSSHA